METITFPFPAELRNQYRRGKLFPQWKKRYGNELLLREIDPSLKQFPIKKPVKNAYGFGELLVGTYLLECGYDVLFFYYGENWRTNSCRKARSILGEKAANLICSEFPQPPDLLVVDRRERFCFVETKLPGDKLSKGQVEFFANIEGFLNQNMPPKRRIPFITDPHWIRVVRLKPHSRTAE